MIVVTDTSPLNYLVLIAFQDILPKLFDRIVIPGAVRHELESAAAPDAVKRFLASEPAWLETRVILEIDPKLRQLGPGEREAIALASAISADLVLLDDRRGRQAARDAKLAVSGTLGVLDLAVRRGLVEMPEVLARLERTTFRASPRLLRLMRDRAVNWVLPN